VKKILFAFLLLGFVSCAPTATKGTPNPTAAVPSPRVPGMTSSAFVDAPGIERVYYESAGQGPSVVFIHGIGGGNSSMQWQKNALALTASHKVFVLDLPGFARSGARPILYDSTVYIAAIENFLKTVVKEPSSVICSSLACAYSIKIAAEKPALVSKLLLVSPTGIDRLVNPPNTGFYDSLANGALGSVLYDVLKSSSGIGFFLYNQVYLDWSLANDGVVKLYQGNLEGSAKGYPVFAFIAQYANLSVKDLWGRVTQPARIVWGTDDVNTPVSGAQAFLDLKKVPLDVLTGRAIPNDESPERFNNLMLEFLKQRI
jgi:pimeloyl-ACP methyl ester carboxylesterase